jgi:hypothetical protein
MTVQFRELERAARVAPFGVQFRDPLSASFVRDGLEVALHPADNPRRRVYAHLNRSDVYVLHNGPGLTPASFGRGDEAYWLAPPVTRDYRCEVRDLQSRYLPVSFGVRLPFRGLFTPECGSPPAQGVALYSAPTRLMTGERAVVRAELVNAATGKSAAWAAVTAHYRGAELGRGIADAQGRLLLAFPYPEPGRSPPEEPEAGVLMSWEIDLRVYYDAGLGGQQLPDYCALLAQPEASLLEERSPPRPLDPAKVVLGRELVYPRLFIA